MRKGRVLLQQAVGSLTSHSLQLPNELDSYLDSPRGFYTRYRLTRTLDRVSLTPCVGAGVLRGCSGKVLRAANKRAPPVTVTEGFSVA